MLKSKINPDLSGTHTKLILTFLFFTFLSTNLFAQYAQWVSRYNGPGYSYDYSQSLAVDNSGNVYVTGWSTGNGTYVDYATIKYNSAGVQQWVQRYDGPENDTDYVRSIAVDGQGNVYITGSSDGNGTGSDYATIKYNSAGVQRWVARYNGPGNGNDDARSIAVDDSGNVYVTGGSIGTGTGWDYATIKYNSAGVQQWVQRYNSTGNGNENASSISVDGSGNVYVTGSRYTTIKYNSSGVQQWIKTDGGVDATSIAVDDSGNVYVTGARVYHYYDSYATIKYNSSGVQQWVQIYSNGGEDVANSITVDNSGYVYVTGKSQDMYTWWDYATIKYNSNGDSLWVKRYGGDGAEYARSIAVDGSGNVYVTGSGYTTIKYNSSGVQQWIKIFGGSGEGIVVDGFGNVYVTGSNSGGGTGSDYVTIKYNSSGDTIWVRRYNGPGGNAEDDAYKLVVGGQGNVYVTGRSYGSGTGLDYATLKYNSLGVQQWAQRYNGPGNSLDYASSIAMDVQGNVYVTGGSVGNGTYLDYATIKYNSAGIQQWVSRYNYFIPSHGYRDDGASSIAVDGSGNVYVTGNSVNYCSGHVYQPDYLTIKYNSAGIQQWVSRYKGTYVCSFDNATSIAVDDSGNVYVTGGTERSPNHYDYATIKYNSNGDSVWVARYNGPGSSDCAYSIAVDDSGNVYVTGTTATIKYNSAGVQQWISLYSGNDIAVDDSGYVYTTSSGATIKYNSAGVRQWISTYGGSGNDLTIDDSGNVYITGSIGGDYGTVKYNTDGVQRWVLTYNGPGYGDDNARSIAVDGSGYVYVTGRSDGPGTGFDYTTIKYSQPPTPIPAAPVLVSPANGATLVATNPLLDWNSSAYAESYQIQVSTDSLFTSTVYDSSGIIITEFQIPNNGLNINTTYYWRVNAANVTGTSPWSTIFHFTTGATNIVHNNEIPKEFRLYNSYPNPFNPSTKIKFDIPKSSCVKLIVYDILGREIKTLVNEKLNAGRYEIDWDGSSYPSGVYFYKLVTDEYFSVKKMLMIK